MLSVQDILIYGAEQATQTGIEIQVGQHIERLLNHPNQTKNDIYSGEVSTSVLNYGLPSIVGKQIDNKMLDRVVSDVTLALMRFEPRLNRSSIKVQTLPISQNQPHILCVDVSADLANAPLEKHPFVNVHLRLNFDIHFGLTKVQSLNQNSDY